MFEFGTPEDIARTWFEQAVGSAGPGLTEAHYEDLEEEELKNLLVYIRIAYFRASKGDASEEVIQVITEWHDEVFLYLLEALDGFRSLVCNRVHQPIGDRNKYWGLAGCGSAN